MKTELNNKNRLVKIIERVGKLFGGRIIIGLAIPIGFLLFFGWLTDEVFEGATKNFDESIREFVHGFASPLLTNLMIFFSFLGSPIFLTFFSAIIIAGFLYLKNKRAIVIFVITITGAIALDLALKPFFGRVRPLPFFDYPLPLSYSFPSGHALGSLCFYGILGWLVAEQTKTLATKIVIGMSALSLILFIGISRIYLGVHYPSDVLAGYIAGAFWVVVIALVDSRLYKNKSKLSTVEDG